MDRLNIKEHSSRKIVVELEWKHLCVTSFSPYYQWGFCMYMHKVSGIVENG